ncbi:hypothetical protein [uncultured Erythrobacter sp.]|uniref:hypothetical protein n=1 Tax=uncultured Erythrobacter sp. TaxID=263913 RepID=UPI002624572A|nr:hypothetical protein [uncultured Erythrobacter sp.]
MLRAVQGLVIIGVLASCTGSRDGGVATAVIEPAVIEEPSPLPPPSPPPPLPPALTVEEPSPVTGVTPGVGLAIQGNTNVEAGNLGSTTTLSADQITRAFRSRDTANSGRTRGVQITSRAQSVPTTSPTIEEFPAAAEAPLAASSDPCAPGEPASLSLPRYPSWPPEEASSRIALDRYLGPREGRSLYETGQMLRDALNEAGYEQHAFYAVPGGYIIVTETERTDPEGAGVRGTARYLKPGEDRIGLLVSIRDLFLERPKTYYRYLAIVVSDRPFCAARETLAVEEAERRVIGGFSDLSDDTREIDFSDRYRVTALIYEFVNDGIGYDLSMIAPGRIPPREHLKRSGLDEALPRIFAPVAEQSD